MKKLFLLDTSVIMRNSKCFYVFDDNDVCISFITLEELDGLKTVPGEKGYSAREAIREILKIKTDKNKLPGGGTFRILNINGADSLSIGLKNTPDNIIIQTAKEYEAFLITSDISMLLKAESLGVNAEIFYNEQASEESFNYTGYTKLYLTPEDINKFYSEKRIEIESPELIENEFILLVDINENKNAGLGRYTNGAVIPLKYLNEKPYGITPKNFKQKFALEALLAPASEIPLVIIKGPAGTAKTFLSIAAGLHQVTDTNVYRKLLVTRPNIKFDEDIGYLKGTEMDKILPLIRPCLDNLETLVSNKNDDVNTVKATVDYLFEKGWITAEALAYFRGRSIANTYTIIDEAQNSTPKQMQGILTRTGLDSKMVIIGDPEQIDNPKLDEKNNGLCFASDRMRGDKCCAQITFEEEDCVRSELSKVAAERLK